MADEKKNIKWYQRKELWGGVLTASSGILELFDNDTIAYKVGVGLGIILTVTGLRSGYQYNNLPSGLSKVMDKIPDAITGTKGEKANGTSAIE